MPPLPPCRFVPTNGIELATYSMGSGPAVILLHGFPELAFSWRHQMPALAAAGWRAVAPDLRGFGRTGLQGDVTSYRLSNLARDVLGMIRYLGLERPVVIGHDFGGMLAWALARDYPTCFSGIVSLNTPYTRKTPKDLVQTVRERARGDAHYMVAFQTPGVAERALERDLEGTFRSLFRRPAMTLREFQANPRLAALPLSLFTGEPEAAGASLMSDAELQVYVEAFRRTGFTGALNWYRNLALNWEEAAGARDRIELPALMITASSDYFLPPSTSAGMEKIIARLDRAEIDCGHWTQHEQPERVNEIVLNWLATRMPPR